MSYVWLWLLIPLALGISGIIYEGLMRRRFIRMHQAPGTLIDIRGRKLHVMLAGSEGPTVVFENGAGTDSPIWWRFIAQVSSFTSVCVYDRAGLGWSEAASLPRTLEDRAADLYAILKAANVPGPYVLVGFSYGALLVRLFMRDHKEDVAGLVFIDAGHELVYSDPEVQRTNLRRLASMVRVMRLLARIGLVRLLNLKMPIPSDGLTPEQDRLLVNTFPSDGAYSAAADDFISMEQCAEAMRGLDQSESLNAIPIVVLTHGQPFPGMFAILERNWRAAQENLCALSSNSKLVIAEKSSHAIPIEEPELVMRAIQDVVEASRARSAITA